MSECIDLTGQVFGRLKVLYRVENDRKGQARWLCQCSCNENNTTVVTGYRLRKGKAQSCGCLSKETKRQKIHKKHDWKMNGEVVYGKFFNCEEEFCFSSHRVKQFEDMCFHKTSDGYVATRVNGKIVAMHQLIFPNAIVVDHRDQNKLNNTDSNLIPCTYKENNENTPIFKTNTSGYKGVCWDKVRHKWMAYIDHNGKRINLGRYEDLNDAIKARLKKEIELFTNPSRSQIDLYNQFIKGNE